MSQKRKRGLQRGLSDIVAKQTAPREDKSKLSRGLIDKFTEPRSEGSSHTLATQGTQGSRPPSQPQPSPAPTRDFMKVANSIGREAVPAGMFKGKGKQIYDYLYSKTRGAITPTLAVQVSRREIMKGAHVGSDKTLRENLLHLRSKGLINWDDQEHRGEHSGNLYTVYLPEEATTMATQGTQGTEGNVGQFLPSVPRVETTQGTQGLPVDNADSSSSPKTSFKTNTIDDDERTALSDLNNIFTDAALKLTGRRPQANEREKWAELARVIVAELNEAAARAGSVSSVPAFLSEHLRRKFAQRATERKRAGKRAAPVEEQSAASVPGPKQDLRLTPEEIAEQARLIAELLESGYTIEQAEAQFSGGVHPEDWTAIREAATGMKEQGSNTSA